MSDRKRDFPLDQCRCHLETGPVVLVGWEIVKAHVDPAVERPKTLHYRGNGRFMIAGEEIDRAANFRDEML